MNIVQKASLVFLCVMLLGINAFAQSLYNVKVEDKPLSVALASISAQCEYKFVYNTDFIAVSPKVTLNVS